MLTQPLSKLSLRLVLIIPFALEVLVICALATYVFLTSGQKAVENLAEQLLIQQSNYIQTNLRNFLDIPAQIIEDNQNLVNAGLLNFTDMDKWESHFWHQYPQNSSEFIKNIAIASSDGEYRSVGLNEEGSKILFVTGKKNNFQLQKYLPLDLVNIAQKPNLVLGKFSASELSWYQKAIAKKENVWSQNYDAFKPLMVLSAPLYDRERKQIKAVTSVTINEKYFSNFLQSLKFAQEGVIFIVDHKGDLIASSNDEVTWVIKNKKLFPLSASQSHNELTKYSYENINLSNSYVGFKQLNFKQREYYSYKINFQENSALNWKIVIVLPKIFFRDYLEINNNKKLALIIIIIITIFIVFLTAKSVTQPISELNKAAKKIAQGQWETPLKIKRYDEIGELALSFNLMAEQIQRSFQTLKQNEENLTIFLDGLPIGMAIFDQDSNIIFINEQLEIIVDSASLSELVSRTNQIYVNSLNTFETKQNLPKLETILSQEIEINCQNGQVIPLKIQTVPLFDEQDNLRYVMKTFVDITDRRQIEKMQKNYEQDLKHLVAERTKALKESEEKFRRAFDDAAIGMALNAIDGRWLEVNRSLCEMVGYSEQELLSKTFQDLTHPEDLETDLDYGMQALQGKIRTYQIQKRLFERKGQIIWVLLSVSLVRDHEGKPLYFISQIQDITDLKEATEKIQAAELQYRTLVEQIPGVVYRLPVTTGSKLAYTSPQIKQLLNLSQQDWNNSNSKNWLEYIHPEDKQRVLKELENWKKGWGSFFTEYRMITEDERVIWVQDQANVVLAGDNKTFLLQGLIFDITERKALEKEVASREAQLNAFFNSAPLGLNIIDEQLRFVKINEQLAKINGLPLAEHQGKKLLEVVPHLAPTLEPLLQQVLNTGEAVLNIEVSGTVASQPGVTRYWLVSYFPIPASLDQTKWIGTVVLEISDRKQAELALQERETMLRTLGDNLDKGVIYQLVRKPNGECKFTYISRGIQKLVEVEPESVIQNPETLWSLIVGEDRHVCEQLTEESYRNLSLFQMQMRKRTPDGGVQWSQLRSIPRRLADGTVIWDGLEVDITELKKIEMELQQAKDKAEAASGAKSEFLANMSHEIRTPMNAIFGFCQLLQGLVTDQRQRSYLDTIIASSKTLLALINDILDLSKIEAGKVELNYGSVNLRAILLEIKHIFTEKVVSKKLNLIIEFAEDMPNKILFDEIRLRQILFNVVGNAIKFTEQGHVKIKAEINTYELKLEINDTGIGIAPEQQERIFEAFVQSEGQSTRKYGGTGLGLAITKRLTKMLGGTIELNSEVGKGSIFTFIFPQVEILQGSVEVSEKELTDENLNQFQKSKILVVDDVQSNLYLMTAYFSGSKHQLIFAMDGKEGIKQAIIQRPDLIILDLWMPNFNGIEVTRLLKQNRATKNIPIIIVTASSRAQDEASLESLCEGFIRKPVNLSQLVSQLKKVLALDADYLSQKQEILDSQVTQASKAETFYDITELIAQLKQQENTFWHEVSQKLKMRDIKAFKERLHALALEYNSKPLLDYTNLLESQLASFDWENLPNTVKQFPQIIQKLS